MKLPTLNVDLRVNTKSMERDIAEANKKMQQVGKKTLALGGGAFGKFGALGEMGGAFGQASIIAGAVGLAAAAPIMAANAIMESWNDAVKKGAETMKQFAEGKDIRAGGLSMPFAASLAAGQEAAAARQMATQGVMPSFWGAASNEFGQVEGVLGWITDWAQATGEGFKALVAGTGAFLGGQEVGRAMDIATTRSVAGGQAYMTQEQLDRLASAVEKLTKQQRESST